MLWQMRGLGSIIVFISALAVLAGCGGSSNKAGGAQIHAAVLTLADGEDDVTNARPFVNTVARLSHGTLLIQIKGPWRPGDPRYEPDLIKDVEAGKAQLGISASRAFDVVGIDSFDALQAPFLIDSIALERRVLASGIPDAMLSALKPAGLIGLAMVPGPLRRPAGFARALLAPADYRGEVIGIRASVVTEEALHALGAQVMLMTNGNNVTGMNGAESHLALFDAGIVDRGATITGNVDFEPRPNVIFMNRRAFDAMTPAERRILLRAAAEVRTTESVYQPDAESARDLCRRGVRIVTASAADLAELRATVRPVYATLKRQPATRAFIGSITSMRRALGDSPDAARCATIAVRPGTEHAATELDGTWEVTYTRAEFFAAGAGGDENLPSNWGHEVLTFNRGLWRLVSPDVGPGAGPGSGTFVLHGHEITLYRSDHAYPGSDTEIWGPYIWSVYRDALSFREGNDFNGGPTMPVVKPWRRSANGG
jgi:TRAP-type C4-dicarboxylate transport system substrate-binding protein